MEKIVNGKIYDTSKSEYICKHYEGDNDNETNYTEVLHRSPKGQFFIAAQGGGYSKYSNNSDSEGHIVLLSESEAKEFIEKYGHVEYYLRYFEAEEG